MNPDPNLGKSISTTLFETGPFETVQDYVFWVCYRYKVPNIKVPNLKIPNHKIPTHRKIPVI
jgi:hypothetical protein